MWESTLGMRTHWHKDASTAGLSHAPFLDTFNAQEHSLKFTAAVCFNRNGWIEVSGLGHLNSRCYSWSIFPIYSLRTATKTSLDSPWDTAYMLSEGFSCYDTSRYLHSGSKSNLVKMKGNAFLCFSFVNVTLQINPHCLCKNVSLWACYCMQGYSEYDYQTPIQFFNELQFNELWTW